MLKSSFSDDKIEAGCDEVGRGCLAGPVVAAAVILPADYKHNMLTDSKQLSKAKRELIKNDILNDAMKDFEENNFKAALKSYRVILEHYPQDINAYFYGALCYYNLGKADKAIIYFDNVIANEFAFLEKIFEGRTLSTISKDDVREYILYRANDRLARLGVQKTFKYNEASATRIKEWFHPLMKGATSTDFFAQSKDGSNYTSKPVQDFMGVNLKTLDLVLS